MSKLNKVSLVEDLSNELLELMGTQAKAYAEEDVENDCIKVNIDTKDETGLLIGRRGETLTSLQSILGMIYRAKTGEWTRILVNVGDWREKQEDYLKNLAKDTADRVKATGEPQPLYNLTPAERRIIHMELAQSPEVETESIGEDAERYLLVKPRK